MFFKQKSKYSIRNPKYFKKTKHIKKNWSFILFSAETKFFEEGTLAKC